MITYLRLHQQFDALRMQREVALLEEQWWKEHYNKADYEGGWTVVALRSRSGSIENIYAMPSSPEEAQCQDTPLLLQCPYLQEVLSFFQCRLTTVRLMKLHAGAIIKEHRDGGLRYEDGEVRFHIPVFTNPGVGFYLEDEQVVMKEGECWYLDLSRRHRVKNEGNTHRIHLVIDAVVNDWVKELFAGQAIVKKEIERSGTRSRDEQQAIIQQLRLLNTPTSMDLADQLENELP